MSGPINDAIIVALVVVLAALVTYKNRGYLTQPMREKLSRMWWHYCWGMFSTGTNGAAAAVKGTLGVAAGAAFNPQQIQAPNLYTLLYIFGVAFALNALDWVTKNPLPANLDESTPPFAKAPTTLSPSPKEIPTTAEPPKT